MYKFSTITVDKDEFLPSQALAVYYWFIFLHLTAFYYCVIIFPYFGYKLLFCLLVVLENRIYLFFFYHRLFMQAIQQSWSLEVVHHSVSAHRPHIPFLIHLYICHVSLMIQAQLNGSVVEGVKGYDVPFFASAQYKLSVKSADGPNSIVKFENLLFKKKIRLLRMLFVNSSWLLDLLLLHPPDSFHLIYLHFLHQPPFLLPEVGLKQLLSSLVQAFLFLRTVDLTFLKTELARLSISHKLQLFQFLLLTLPQFNFLTVELRHDEVSESRPISLIFAQHILINSSELPVDLQILLPLPYRLNFPQHILHCQCCRVHLVLEWVGWRLVTDGPGVVVLL